MVSVKLGMSLGGGSRICVKGVHMYTDLGIRFADFFLFFLSLTKANLFHFHRIF